MQEHDRNRVNVSNREQQAETEEKHAGQQQSDLSDERHPCRTLTRETLRPDDQAQQQSTGPMAWRIEPNRR